MILLLLSNYLNLTFLIVLILILMNEIYKVINFNYLSDIKYLDDL